MWIKVLIIIVFIGIVAALGSSLFFLVNDKGDSKRTVRALTWRIGLSLGLFLFLMALVGLGIIKPHGVYPVATSSSSDSSQTVEQ